MKRKMIIKIMKRYSVVFNERYFYITLCNSQGQVMATSEMYNTKQAAQKAIESFRRYGLNCKVKEC